VRPRRRPPRPPRAYGRLDRGLRRHLVDAPTFLVLANPQDPDVIASRLAEPGWATFLAEDGGGPVAFLRAAAPGDDVATLVKDSGTLSINSAFTRADRRGGGVAGALVGVAAAWAREQGYVRLGVDFESANVLASRFWTRWFIPVVAACVRRLPGAAGPRPPPPTRRTSREPASPDRRHGAMTRAEPPPRRAQGSPR
jgi:GNAT superfamily N-acetyltransferase